MGKLPRGARRLCNEVSGVDIRIKFSIFIQYQVKRILVPLLLFSYYSQPMGLPDFFIRNICSLLMDSHHSKEDYELGNLYRCGPACSEEPNFVLNTPVAW